MKAIVIHEPGGPEKLVYSEVDRPEIKPGWSLIKVKGFGINHSEIFTRKGLSPTVTFPRILGIECVGIIEETTDPDRLPVGQKVLSIMGEMGREFNGSYAEFVLVPNEQIYQLNSSLPWEDLAAIPETYYTAFGSLKNLKIQSADHVLIRGATSGIGISFLNLIKGQYPDSHVTGSTRQLKNEKQLLDLGYDDIIEDAEGKLQTIKTFDKVVELVGPATLKNSFKHINEYGIVCSTGQLGGEWYMDTFDPIIHIRNNSYLTSFYSGNVDQKRLDELFDFLKEYRISVQPKAVFNLKEVSKSHLYLESNDFFGKIVIVNN